MRPPTYIPKLSYQRQWQNPAQSWSPSWTGWQEPMYRGSTHWLHWSPSQWQEWGSGRHYAAQPWQKNQEPRVERRRRQQRRSQRQGQGKFMPPEARPIVTPSPAAAKAPAPAASQIQITPPGPQTPPCGTQTAEMNALEWLISEIDASKTKPQKGSPRTPERKSSNAGEGSSPKKQKQTVWKPKPPQAETSKWPRMYTPLSQILYTPEHAVKNGVVAQDIGVRLCPSSLPKRGVSRNHSGSQLCS